MHLRNCLRDSLSHESLREHLSEPSVSRPRKSRAHVRRTCPHLSRGQGRAHVCPHFGHRARPGQRHVRDWDIRPVCSRGRWIYATGESAVMRLEGTTSNTSWWSPRAALGVHRLGVPLWAPLASCKRVEHFKQICNLDNVEQWFGNRWATYPR